MSMPGESVEGEPPARPLSAEKLRRAFAHSSPSQIPDALRLLRDTRELLEETGTKQNFETVGLYCDWCLHSAITESRIGHDLLIRVNEVLIEYMSIGPKGAGPEIFSTAITRALKIDALRRQLLDLYSQNDVHAPFLASYRSWHHLLGEIFKEIAEKPIRFPTQAEVAGSKRGGRLARIRQHTEAMWDGVELNGFEVPLFVDELILSYQNFDPENSAQLAHLHWRVAVRPRAMDGRTIWLTTPMVPLEGPRSFEFA